MRIHHAAPDVLGHARYTIDCECGGTFVHYAETVGVFCHYCGRTAIFSELALDSRPPGVLVRASRKSGMERPSHD